MTARAEQIAPPARVGNHTSGGACPPRLALSLTEAAETLGVSLDFFSEHIAHELRVVRRGRRRLVPASELQRWLEASAERVL